MIRAASTRAFVILLLFGVVTLAACEDEEKAADGDGCTTIETPVATVTDSGIQITDLVTCDGEEAQADSTVTVHYTVFLEDGTRVQSSKDTGQPYTRPLSELIPGWQEGMPGMKVGGTRRLVIPPGLAYGAAGSPPTIPPNATLTFEIELLDVQ